MLLLPIQCQLKYWRHQEAKDQSKPEFGIFSVWMQLKNKHDLSFGKSYPEIFRIFENRSFLRYSEKRPLQPLWKLWATKRDQSYSAPGLLISRKNGTRRTLKNDIKGFSPASGKAQIQSPQKLARAAGGCSSLAALLFTESFSYLFQSDYGRPCSTVYLSLHSKVPLWKSTIGKNSPLPVTKR